MDNVFALIIVLFYATVSNAHTFPININVPLCENDVFIAEETVQKQIAFIEFTQEAIGDNASLSLFHPILGADLITINFNETFTCSTGKPNTVQVSVCESDAFSGDDCTAWVTRNCGASCTILVAWSDTGDEWPGTEFEFYVQFKHTCKPGNGLDYYNPNVADKAINEPIDGPKTRTLYHSYNLDTYPPGVEVPGA